MLSALVGLVRAHWGMGSKALADSMAGTFSGGTATAEFVSQFDRFQRISVTGDMAANLLEAALSWDVRDLVPLLTMPSVMLHRRDDQAIPFEEGRKLAMLLLNGSARAA